MESKFEILICDDEQIFVEKIKSIIQKTMIDQQVEYQIKSYSSGNEFLNQFIPQRKQLIFLDIDMPDISGSVIAERLEELRIENQIIFVSGYDNLILENLHHRPFQFIQKNKMELEIPEAVKKYLLKYERSHKEIRIKSENGWEILNTEEIQFVECRNHTITFFLDEMKEISIRSVLSEWEKKLPEEYFVRAHKGFLVNVKRIRLMEKTDLWMENGKKVPLSRNYKEQVTRKMLLLMR